MTVEESCKSVDTIKSGREYLPDLEPTPSTVVSLPRSIIPQLSKTPEILMTPPLLTADLSAEQEVTVVPEPLPPPVVPDAYPTSPLMAAEPQEFVAVVVDPDEVLVDVAVLVVALLVEVAVVDAAVPVK